MSIRAFLLSVLLAASMPVMAGVVISPASPGDSCPNTPVWFKGTVTVDLTVLPSGEARSDAYPTLKDGARVEESRWVDRIVIGNDPFGCQWAKTRTRNVRVTFN